MKARKTRGVVAISIWLAGAAPTCFAGKLDLDMYSSQTPPRKEAPRRGGQKAAGETWRPGDPRDLKGEPVWAQVLSPAGYAGLGLAGVVTSVAAGSVAPAVGFGIITVVHILRGWKLHQALAADPNLNQPSR